MNRVVRAFLLGVLLSCGWFPVLAQAPSLSTRLFAAVEAGKPEVVRTLVGQGANLEAKNKDGETPLLMAIQAGDANMIKVLLDAGANQSVHGGLSNYSALHWAVLARSPEIVKLLLERKADLEAKNETGQTPLNTATDLGEAQIALLLLDHGANLEARGDSALTPLMSAAAIGYVEMVKLLLERGAQMDAALPNGQTALELAKQSGKTAVVSLLQGRMEAAKAQRELDNKLVGVIEENNADKVQLLLDAGAGLEARLKSKYTANYAVLEVANTTPLMVAVGANKLNLVQMLLARGAKIDAGAKIEFYYYPWVSTVLAGEYTPLTLAITRNELPIVQLLLAQGANYELKGSEGRTPLLWAIDLGATEIAKALLAKGADPEVKDNKGQAALQHAAIQGNVEIGNLLRNGNARYRQLEQTPWRDPQEQFSAYVNALANDLQSALLRRKVLELAAGLPAPPAVPEAARLLFQQASQQLQTATTPGALELPIASLRRVIGLAPWWANAYYNLARALEMNGKYDEAVAQLEFYLASKPTAEDAAEARTRMAALRTAKSANPSR